MIDQKPSSTDVGEQHGIGLNQWGCREKSLIGHFKSLGQQSGTWAHDLPSVKIYQGYVVL